MNLTGWEQLLFVCAVTALLAPLLGRYLAATFSYLPGGRPPVPPDVRTGEPDGTNRHFIGPARTDGFPGAGEGRPRCPYGPYRSIP